MSTRANRTATPAPSLPHRVARAFAALPDLALLAVVAVAYVGVTLWLGRHLWFDFDECDFFTRSLGNPMDYLSPHNEHFVAVPFLLYGVWRLLVGTQSYAPYLLLLAITQIFMAAGVYRLWFCGADGSRSSPSRYSSSWGRATKTSSGPFRSASCSRRHLARGRLWQRIVSVSWRRPFF